MAIPLQPSYVYCFQKGSADCYKIGRTAREPEKRKRNVSTGSSEKLIIRREIPTPYPAALEAYLHNLLDDRRTDNGEFFNVTLEELDASISQALGRVNEYQPLIIEAKSLSASRPNETTLPPTDETRRLYRELRTAYREQFFLEQQIAGLESRLQIHIGANRGIDGLATWKWVPRSRLNTKLFRAEQSDLYEQYRCDASRREFRLEQKDLLSLNAKS